MSFTAHHTDLTTLSDEQLSAYSSDAMDFVNADRQEWQLLYYQPVSPQALEVHVATEHLIGIGGGNRSGKTDTNLAELAIQMTGVIPESLKKVYPREKLRGPISARVVCESITTTLAPVILRKLNFSNWNGVDVQGGERGHWGWIPRCCLINGDWDRSWKETKRTLTVICRDPDNLDRVLGYSTLQCMSHDQETAKFASGEFHLVIIDEPPKYPIFVENRARVMSVGGRVILGMTWPDDPTIPVDWIFDKVYDIGQQGPDKHPDVRWIELNTLQNPNIDQVSVAREAAAMNEMERNARIKGKPIRFSHLIHPLFTDQYTYWCFHCNEESLVDGAKCTRCDSDDTVAYGHVQDFAVSSSAPTIFLLDPHPRKPHMFCYIQVDGNDDYSMVYAGEADKDPLEFAEHCKAIERERNLIVAKRLIDPNMARSPASAKRGITWLQEFASAGLYCDLADNSDVGRVRVNEFLKPDARTRRPRLRFHADSCQLAIYQMKRFSWDNTKYQENRDIKQTPKPKYDDYPALLRYLMNDLPLHSVLQHGGQVVAPAGQMKGGY